MSIREQIMALALVAGPHDGHIERSYMKHHAKAIRKAANIAEARERELLGRMAQMIAELRCLINDDYVLMATKKVKAVINKYEALK
jgi:hypothetical protein